MNNNPNYSRNLGIETIYQDLALADNLDVPSNIFLGREPIKKSLKFLHRLDRNFMYEQSVDVLESLKIEIPIVQTIFADVQIDGIHHDEIRVIDQNRGPS